MLLEENYRICESCAESVDGWRDMSKSDLIRMCVGLDTKSLEYQSLFSALLCRHWYMIDKYYAFDKQFATPEDIFDWVSDSMTYAITHHRWDNPDCSSYGVKDAPESVFMTVFKSTRMTAYQSSNRFKRKINPTALSTDKMQEENADSMYQVIEDESITPSPQINYIEFLVKKYFDSQRYLEAFIIDSIANDNVFSTINGDASVRGQYLNLGKLNLRIRNIDDLFISSFSDLYGYSKDDVRFAVSKILPVQENVLSQKIQRVLKGLSLDNDIRDMLC